MTTKVISLEQFKWRKVGRELRYKLGEFSDQPFFAREAARAQQLYMENLDHELISQHDEFIMERCFEWFIFDYELSTGETVIDLFQKNPDLSEPEKILLEEWSKSRISLYEAIGFSIGQGLVLQDLILKTRITVHEPGINQEINPGMILLIRVLKVGEVYEFSTGGLALPAICKKLLLEKVDGDLTKYCLKDGSANRENINSYLKNQAISLNIWVIEMGLNYILPHVVNNVDLDIKGNPLKPEDKIVSDQIAREITNVFLDDYYDRWVDHPLSALNGLTPRQACRNAEGREQLREILRELESVEIKRERNGEPAYDFKKVWRKLGLTRNASKGQVFLSLVKNKVKSNLNTSAGWGQKLDGYRWPFPGCIQVARQVLEDLRLRGYSNQQLDSALRLWHDYCWLGHPSFRKSAVWVASVVYTMARLELDREVNQNKLAAWYGVAPSSISLNFRNLCRTLGLVAFDGRYSTHRPAFSGHDSNCSLLIKVGKNQKH